MNQYWSNYVKDSTTRHIETNYLIVEDNVIFEDNGTYSISVEEETKVGNNVDLMGCIFSNSKIVTVGDDCKLNFNYTTNVSEIIIGDNAQITSDFFGGVRTGFDLKKVRIGKGLKIVTGETNKFLGDREEELNEGEGISIEGIAYVADYAVQNCTANMEIIIEENANIGNYAFQNCTGITKVTIEDGVQIGENAFEGCTGLKEVILGNATIASTAFKNCTAIEKVTIKDGAGENFAEGLFANFTTITTVELGKNVTFSNYLFEGIGIQTLTIGEQSYLNEGSFNSCSNLTKIEIGAGSRIGGLDVFAYCDSLTEVIIKAGTTINADGPFYQCSNLQLVTIEEGVVSEESEDNIYTFSECDSLQKITIPNSFGYIPTDAFTQCYALEEITVLGGEKTIKIAERCVGWCEAIKTINLPSNVEIHENAFDEAKIETIKINQTQALASANAPWGAKSGVKVIYSDGEVTY